MSDRIVAEQVAAHVGLFSDVMASDGDYNLRGLQQAESLIARYGDKKFGYAGNSHHDIDMNDSAERNWVELEESGLFQLLYKPNTKSFQLKFGRKIRQIW